MVASLLGWCQFVLWLPSPPGMMISENYQHERCQFAIICTCIHTRYPCMHVHKCIRRVHINILKKYTYIYDICIYIYIWPCACARLHAFLVQNAFKQDPIQVPDRIHFSTARSNTSSCCSFPWSCPACRGKAQSFSGSGDSCGYGMPMGCLWDAWYPGGHLEMVGRWLISGLSSPQIWFVIGLEPSISFFRRF